MAITHWAERFLKEFENLPELLRVKDLVNVGFFKDKDEAYRTRSSIKSLIFTRLKEKILYNKHDVKAFVLERIEKTSVLPEV